MPKLTKIRIVGAHYDKCRKKHENTIIDLTKDNIPEHTLLTLENGCGKGVMLQLISQLLLPNESWGKNDGNTIRKMFYKDSGQLFNYTFHIALEFDLEVEYDARIILGAAFTVERKYDEENEETAKLRYFHYILNTNKDSFLNIRTLPMFENERAKEFNEYKKFINENKDISLYHKSETSRGNSAYYQYLKSYNIHKDDWKLYKRINKNEGGVSDYFSKAKDNKALFDKLIIPTIEESLNSEYSSDDSLIEIFKSDIGVTKDLPVLIDREEDYKSLISLINPYMKAVDEYIRYKVLYNNKLDLGKDYYITMKNKKRKVSQNIDSWNKEADKNKEAINECQFQIDSLKISTITNKIEGLKKETEKIKIEESDKEKLKKIILDEIKILEINKLLIPRKEKIERLNQFLIKKENLIKLNKKENLKQELNNIEENIIGEFDDAKDKINSFYENHYGYLNFLRNEIENEEKNKIKVNKEIQNLVKEINKFELQEEKLEKRYDSLLNDFNAFSLAVPEKLLEDKEKELEIIVKEHDEIVSEIEKNKISIINFDKEISNQEILIMNDEKELLKLEKERKNARLEEKNINDRLYSLLNNNVNIVNKENLLEFKSKLIKLREEKEIKINNIHKNIWELQLDNSINTFEYWIPNADILKVKEAIENLNIDVLSGSEYIFLEGDKEGKRLIESYPILPYGLVIMEDKIEYIEKNIDLDILRSPIPIYIRNKMAIDKKNSFKLLKNSKAYSLLEVDKFNKWLSKLDKNETKYIENIEIIKWKINEINDVISLVEIKLEKEFYYELNKKVQNKKDSIKKFKNKMNLNKNQKEQLAHSMKILDNEKEKLEKILKIEKENIAKLDTYLDLKNVIERLSIIYKKNKNKLETFEKNKIEIEKAISDKKYSIRVYSDEFIKIRKVILVKLESSRKIIDIEKLDISESSKVISKKPVYELIKSPLWESISLRDEIINKLEEKNDKILVINTQIDSLKEQIDEKEKELDLIDSNWNQYNVLEINLEDLLIKIKEANTESYALDKDITSIKELLSGKKSEMKVNKEHKKELEKQVFQKYNKTFNYYEENIKELEYKYFNNKKDYIKYQRIISENIEKYKKDFFDLSQLITSIYEKFDRNINGKTNKELESKEIDEISKTIEEWKKDLKELNDKLIKSRKNGDIEKRYFSSGITENINDTRLKERIFEILRPMDLEEPEDIMEALNSLKEGFKVEIRQLEKDKEEKEEICEKWSNRAAGYIAKIAEAIKNMVKSMVYVNENNYSFPLVKLENDSRLNLDKDETLIYIMKKFYIDALKNILENEDFENVSELSTSIIKKYLSTEKIFSVALNGSYPKLLVYKMTEKNEFRYSQSKSRYYDTWEGIHLGEGISTEGSGGQTLSISTFVLMMLLNQKRSFFGEENISNIIIMDNPFSNASSAHILDPVFEIAKQLNFQIVAFAPPEIIKEEISERFPVLWDLRLEGNKSTNISFITGKIKYGGRKIK